jgi:hypothetical protein
MTTANARLALTFGVCLASASCLKAEESSTLPSAADSPESIVRFLTYQSGRPNRELALTGGLRVGVDDDRRATGLLIQKGQSSLPAIQQALDSIETQSERSPFALNADWLFVSYAEIVGRKSLDRLRRLRQAMPGSPLSGGLDNAIAISISATSYVSGAPGRSSIPQAAGERFHLYAADPRNNLDLLLRAWISDDLSTLRQALTPSARLSLSRISSAVGYKEMRRRLNRSNGLVSIGYRFDVSDAWADPGKLMMASHELYDGPESRAIETSFKTRSGVDCGQLRLLFFKSVGPGSPQPEYRIDNRNIGDLLRLITTCAMAP